MTPHVAIIGGGIIGLSAAWRLAQRGCRVEVFEPGGRGRGSGCHGASWASAGLLAPSAEAEPTESALHALSVRSLGAWPAFARELEVRSGVSLDFREHGALQLALTRDDVLRLEHAHAFHERLGTRQQWIRREQMRAYEPELAATALAARLLPDDRQVDPRAVVVALRDVLCGLHVPIHARHVARIALDGAQPTLHGDDWASAADVVLVAAGAWSRTIDGIPEPWRPAVHPVKGQMLAVEMPDGTDLLHHAVFAPRVYLVPRKSGRLLIGATVEDRGFDAGVTAGGLLQLLEGAWRALPAIEEARVVESWCGFRPGSRDDAPLLGFRDERLVYATGHYRNGILLAPATADAIAETICAGREPDWIRDFAPDRFDPAFVPSA
jgi:glycine oxidase